MKAGVTAQSAAKKWQTNAQGASATYTAGSQAAAQAQVTNAVAQAGSWLQGVNQAGENGYTKGVQAAGQAGTYANRVASVGGQRYSQGVATPAATTNFTNQIGKVLNVETTASAALPAKGPKGSAANSNRSTAMQQALHAAKVNGIFQKT
jgi:hypothetical protein